MSGFPKYVIAIIISSLYMAQPGYAHRFYASFTQIDLRDNTQTIEIVHRLFTHDVEDFLRSKPGNDSSLSNAEIELILKEFVDSNFALFDRGGKRLPLTWVGMDYATDDIHIYQEATLPPDPSELIIIDRLFMDLFADEKNTVNVEWNNEIRTRIFIKSNSRQKIDFNLPD